MEAKILLMSLLSCEEVNAHGGNKEQFGGMLTQDRSGFFCKQPIGNEYWGTDG